MAVHKLVDNAPQVLPLYDPPRQKSCLAAVAQIIRELKAKYRLSNVELAERIGVSSETISNAENENNVLSLVTFLRIWHEFGKEAIAPAADLAERRHIEPRSLADRFNELQADLNALRDEVGA